MHGGIMVNGVPRKFPQSKTLGAPSVVDLWTFLGTRFTMILPWSFKIMSLLYAGKCHSNSVDCLMIQEQVTKTYNRLFLANPTDKYACQWSSSPLARSSTGLHICQLDLLGMYNIVFVQLMDFFLS